MRERSGGVKNIVRIYIYEARGRGGGLRSILGKNSAASRKVKALALVEFASYPPAALSAWTNEIRPRALVHSSARATHNIHMNGSEWTSTGRGRRLYICMEVCIGIGIYLRYMAASTHTRKRRRRQVQQAL